MSNEAPLKTQRCKNPDWGDRAADETWIVLECHNSFGTSHQTTLQPVLKDTLDITDPVPPTELLTLGIGTPVVGDRHLIDLVI